MTDEGYPETVEELLEYCARYADGIFLRRKVPDGRGGERWGNLALSQTTVPDALRTVADWIERGHMPVRVLSDEEIGRRCEARDDR